MKVLILGGVGAVGTEATRDFVKTCKVADKITIGDINIEAAKKLMAELEDERVDVVKVDANDEEDLKRVMDGYDYVINALPFRYDYIVNKVAVDVGIKGGVDVNILGKQFELHEKAFEKGILYIPGIGATPGTTNLMAKKAAFLLDEVDTIEIFWAAYRCTAPSPGLLYTTLYEFDPSAKDRVVYENGELRPVPPFYGAKKVCFHPVIGETITYVAAHPEPFTIPKYLGKSVKRVYLRGTWPEETMNLLKTLVYYGFYENEPVEINGVQVKPMDFINKFLLKSKKARETKVWGYGLVVHATGIKDGDKAMVTVWNEHPRPEEWGGRRAYFKPIGIPLSIATQFIMAGRVEKKAGIYPPEAVLNPDEFFKELEKRDIKIKWRLEYL